MEKSRKSGLKQISYYHNSVEIKKVSGEDKNKRDLLMNLVWETGFYKNEEIGEIFGVSYSSVSKSVMEIRQRISESEEMKRAFENYNSLFKM